MSWQWSQWFLLVSFTSFSWNGQVIFKWNMAATATAGFQDRLVVFVNELCFSAFRGGPVRRNLMRCWTIPKGRMGWKIKEQFPSNSYVFNCFTLWYICWIYFDNMQFFLMFAGMVSILARARVSGLQLAKWDFKEQMTKIVIMWYTQYLAAAIPNITMFM